MLNKITISVRKFPSHFVSSYSGAIAISGQIAGPLVAIFPEIVAFTPAQCNCEHVPLRAQVDWQTVKLAEHKKLTPMAAQKTKTEKIPGHQQVVAFLDQLEHPLKTEIQEVRRIILLANQHLTEHIKWNAPSFCYNQQDRVTFNLQGKDHFKLIFHCGAKVKNTKAVEQLFDDATGLLHWITADRATAQFTDLNDVAAKEKALIEVVSKWIEATRE